MNEQILDSAVNTVCSRTFWSCHGNIYTVQKFGVGKIFVCFWKKYLALTKATCIIKITVKTVILWNIITI